MKHPLSAFDKYNFGKAQQLLRSVVGNLSDEILAERAGGHEPEGEPDNELEKSCMKRSAIGGLQNI